MVELISPESLGGRRAAITWLHGRVPADLTGREVTIDCSHMGATSPSFIDEVLRSLVVERNAQTVTLNAVPMDIAQWARQSVARRRMADRVIVDVRGT